MLVNIFSFFSASQVKSIGYVPSCFNIATSDSYGRSQTTLNNGLRPKPFT